MWDPISFQVAWCPALESKHCNGQPLPKSHPIQHQSHLSSSIDSKVTIQRVVVVGMKGRLIGCWWHLTFFVSIFHRRNSSLTPVMALHQHHFGADRGMKAFFSDNSCFNPYYTEERCYQAPNTKVYKNTQFTDLRGACPCAPSRNTGLHFAKFCSTTNGVNFQLGFATLSNTTYQAQHFFMFWFYYSQR